MIINENKIALDLQQALLGSISSNVRGISFETKEQTILVHYLLENESEEDQEEAVDLISEYEALQITSSDIEIKVKVSNKILVNGVGSLKGRAIYARKEN